MTTADLTCQDCSERDSREVIDFVSGHPSGGVEHTLEGCGLEALDSHWKWRSGLCVCRRSDKIVGVLPYSVARAGKLPLALCRSDGGPLAGPLDTGPILESMLGWLEKAARTERACRIELQSFYPLTIDGREDSAGMGLLQGLEAHGFVREGGMATPFVATSCGTPKSSWGWPWVRGHPRHPQADLGVPPVTTNNVAMPPMSVVSPATEHYGTYYVPLADADTMESRLSSPCRRKLRKGLREGVVVQCRTDAGAMDEFIPVYLDMCGRKNLRPRGRKYLLGVRACVQAGTAAVFVCSFHDSPCNFAVVTLTGRPTFWLGAMSSAALSDEVPHTGQALHFEIMKHLHSLGRGVYDFGGSPGPTPQANHPNYGVWKFKHEFNGRYVLCIDRMRRVLSPAGNLLMEQSHKFLRAMRALGV
jgi:hypothetical protein